MPADGPCQDRLGAVFLPPKQRYKYFPDEFHQDRTDSASTLLKHYMLCFDPTKFRRRQTDHGAAAMMDSRPLKPAGPAHMNGLEGLVIHGTNLRSPL